MKKLISVVLALALVLSLSAGVFAADATYYVAGTMNGWTVDGTQMELVDGLYTATFNLDVGTHEFKITDGTWDNNWGWDDNGNNYKFAVSAACAVTITFNADTKEINVSGSGVGEAKMNIEYILAVGAGSGAFLNGENWNIGSTANIMAEADGVYTITYTGVAAGDYEFKFAANGAWTDDWGTGDFVESGVETDIYYKGGNSKVHVAENGSTVSMLLDMTGMDSKGNGAKLTVTVTAPAAEDDSADVKYQTKDNSLRLVTWVDSLDYSEVIFNVTIDGETAEIPCTTVYSSINAGGLKLDNAADVFGQESALYFVTYTIENIPEGVTGFDVSVTWTDLEGNSNTSDVRTITL